MEKKIPPKMPDIGSDLSSITRAQLQENRPLIEALLASLPDSVLIIGAREKQPLVTNRAARAFPAPLRDALCGVAETTATGLYSMDGAKISRKELPARRALRGETVLQQEYLFVDADGGQRLLQVQASPLQQADGTVFAAVVACRDGAPQKPAQLPPQLCGRRYRELFENASDIIYTQDFEGKITSFNQAATRLLGYTQDDLARLHIEDVVSPEDREKAYALLTRLTQEPAVRETAAYEMTVVAKDGQKFILEINPRLIVEGGKAVEIQGVARNITERKQKEADLQASEARFFTIFNSNPLPMSLNTVNEGRYVDVNESWLKENDFTRDEVIGRTLDELGTVNRADRERLRALLRQTKSIKNLEMQWYKKSGEQRTALFFIEPIEINHQPCLLSTALDISERKKQEEQLLLSQWEWRTTFDAIPDAIALINADDRLIRANRAFYEKNSLREATSVGRKIKELIHSNLDYLSSDACPLCELRDKKKGGTIELPPGVITDYPLLASIIPLFDDNGEYLATLQVIRDLSALYSAREEAEQERISLIATIEQMAEGLMIFDEQGKVLRANSSAQTIFGFTLDELLADRSGTLMDNRYADRLGRPLASTEHPIRVALKEQRTVESRIVWYTRPDAKRAFLSITASPFFNEHGRLTGAVAILRDVTAQQKEQERLLQADKLRALGQLASGVAHNFNNALAAIMGYSQLALRKTTNAELQKYLRIVEQSSKDAARMVERIQNFSRTRSKKSEFTSVRIVDIVRDAIDITRPRWRNDAEALGIKYTVSFYWDAPDDLCVNGESSELREVFVNIILNSLDAMPQGGKIVISATATKNSIKIIFKDMGVGMTEEVKRRIFEPFFTTKGASGLGLGLSESYRIVERHNGHLDVESEHLQGTTFSVTLPVLSLKNAHAKRSTGEHAIPRKRFLVIDDEEVVRYAFALVLEDLGHEVARAANAQEAFDLLKRDSYDIVFTDLAMPDVDGIAMAKQIKAQLPNVKIVLMSGYSFDKVQERARETNCIDATMSKPFNMPEIQKLIQRLMEEK